MAGTDTQKQLLTLIRDFASEKSQGERRVVGLKKRIEELRPELETANVGLEDAKRFKVAIEQELKGYEVELALSVASIQTVEARIYMIQDEISKIASEVEALKNEEGAVRDEFINHMVELNVKIRIFQDSIAYIVQNDDCIGTAAEANSEFERKEITERASRNFEDFLGHLVSQIAKEEEEYKEELNILKQVQLELTDSERTVSLMEAIMKETKSLQDLTRQTSELELMCASLGEELQKRCVCPSCHLDNVEALGGIFQANEAN